MKQKVNTDAEIQYPITTTTYYDNGWEVRTDYGPKQGVSVGRVYVPEPVDEEQAARNRAGIDAVLARYGLHLAPPKGVYLGELCMQWRREAEESGRQPKDLPRLMEKPDFVRT